MATAARQTAPRGPLERALLHPTAPPTPTRAPRPLLIPGGRTVKARTRAFVREYVRAGCVDAVAAAQAVGYARPSCGHGLVVKYAELIETERIRVGHSTQMEIDECLRGTASLARAAGDERVQLGAYRTLLQVHGALSEKPLPPAERRSVLATIEELVQSIAEKASASGGGGGGAGGGGGKMRALAEYINKDKRRVRVGVEVSPAPVLALSEIADPGLEPDSPEDSD